jgi:hypothetical protein
MWPILFAFRLRISCRIFLCSLTLSNTSSFLTWSVQLIFFILLQHHIWKLYKICFWIFSTSPKLQTKSPWVSHIDGKTQNDVGWESYLVLKRKRQQGTERNRTVRSFVIRTRRQILYWGSNWEKWD